MYYVTDENKNKVDLNSVISSTEMGFVDAAGLTLTIDGIECYGIYGKVCKITDNNGVSLYQGIGNAIFADKNHDLSYYFTGSDYTNERESSSVINTTNKYGYEWGGYGIETGVTAAAIGTGLYNTNTLISRNLPGTNEWHVVWDKIEEFRETRSPLWFLPSKDELNLIYGARSNLSNLSTSANSYYWSSSEDVSRYAWSQDFNTGEQSTDRAKYGHILRSRLFRQY